MEEPHEIARRLTRMVRGRIEGRRVILAGTLLAPATVLLRALRALGAGPFLIVATGQGTGDLPSDDEAEWVVHEVHAADTIDEFRQIERLMADPPDEIVEAVERFDPGRDALVIFPPYAASPELCGRPGYGRRRPEWLALEDKTTCDALFDGAGVRRPPNEIVAVDRAALLGAASRVDAGMGTVWAGDAKDGFNGGGIFVRWIRPDASGAAIDEALDRFAGQCDHVRVAPFIEGIPCSIHGIVCPDGAAVLRPIELVNLRRPGASQLLYAGAASFFDPPPADRDEMRGAAGKVARLLAGEHDFAGAFTIDGILGADGWVPTELNPRYGGGLGYPLGLYPDLPFMLVHQMLVQGDAPEVRAADIEALLIPAADETRWGGGWTMIPAPFTETEALPVRFVDGRLQVAPPDEPEDGQLMRGPNAVGGFVRLTLDPERTPKGPSIAPRVIAAMTLADELWDARVGPLEPARAVR